MNLSYFFSNLVANPFMCNCHLAWFSEWLNSKGLSGSAPRCSLPLPVKDVLIKDLPKHEFKCTSKYKRHFDMILYSSKFKFKF